MYVLNENIQAVTYVRQSKFRYIFLHYAWAFAPKGARPTPRPRCIAVAVFGRKSPSVMLIENRQIKMYKYATINMSTCTTMDNIDCDARVQIFILATAAGRIACCSVSKLWNKYAMIASAFICKSPELYAGEITARVGNDLADLTADELAAMFSDFHLLCRLKPRFNISTYTICAGGSVQAATHMLIRSGALKMLMAVDTPTSSDTSQQLVLDPQEYTNVMNGAARSGSMEMIRFASVLVPVSDPEHSILCQDISWNTDDVVLGSVAGGTDIIDWWLSVVEPGSVNYMNIFASACAYASMDIITYIHDLCLTAAANMPVSDPEQEILCPVDPMAAVGADFPNWWNNNGDNNDIIVPNNNDNTTTQDNYTPPVIIPNDDVAQLFRPYQGRVTRCVPLKQPENIPTVNIEHFLSATNVTYAHIAPAQSVTRDMLHYQNRKRFNRACNRGMNLHSIFSEGMIQAIKHQRIPVIKLASSFTKGHKADLMIQHHNSMMVAEILGKIDDVDYLDELINAGIEIDNSMPPYSMLLILVSVECPRLISHLLPKIGNDPQTEVIVTHLNEALGNTDMDPIDLLMTTAASYGRMKTIDALIKFKQPTVRHLNRYMSAICQGHGSGAAREFAKYGATMCECGDTHRV